MSNTLILVRKFESNHSWLKQHEFPIKMIYELHQLCFELYIGHSWLTLNLLAHVIDSLERVAAGGGGAVAWRRGGAKRVPAKHSIWAASCSAQGRSN